MSLVLYIINNVTSLFPPTRFYRLKALMYRASGFNFHDSVRAVSSANFWGAGIIKIGRESFIGHDVLVVTGNTPIIIGEMVDIGPRVTIVGGSHAMDMKGVRSAGSGYSEPIVIEDGVWIGAGTTILGGVTIGAKSIIGAGSLVVNNIPERVVAVGSPCTIIKRWDDENNKWDLNV